MIEIFLILKIFLFNIKIFYFKNQKAASICLEVIHPGSMDCNKVKIFLKYNYIHINV